MVITTIKSTYSLDVESVRVLDALAQHWKVSKSEVLRRAIRIAAAGGNPGSDAALGALDQLQSSVRERRVDLAGWGRGLKAERLAAAGRTPAREVSARRFF